VKPYGLANLNKIGTTAVDKDYDAGFDVKYGVTSGLTWDFTVNTDFSQVEADEQQVNLTRFSLFFPEKRDFFLENSGVFQFGSGNTGGGGGANGGRQNVSQDMIFFFSRQIGLSPAGDSIPLLAGTRLTGRVGGWSVGALNIQQREKDVSPSTNFTSLRLRRDILRNSDIGVMMLNKEPQGDHYNRAFGADVNFRFFRDLTMNFAGAKSATPEERLPGSGDDLYSKSSFGYRGDVWETRGMYQTIGSRFNDEMGFVPRVGVDNAEGYLGAHLRFKKYSSWLREFFPHFQIENFTKRNGGGLESRYMDWHVPGEPAEQHVHRDRRQPERGSHRRAVCDQRSPRHLRRSRPLRIQGVLRAGEHQRGGAVLDEPALRQRRVLRRLSQELHRRRTFRMNEHLNVALSDQINDIELPSGAFVTHLVTGRVNYYFNTKVFVNALVQYNTDTNQWSSNARLDIIHRPLSDIYLVYNERHDSRTGALISRAVIAKMTYLFAF
jgi:hypothetical protein